TINTTHDVEVWAKNSAAIEATAGALAVAIGGGGGGGMGRGLGGGLAFYQIGNVGIGVQTRAHSTKAIIDNSDIGPTSAGNIWVHASRTGSTKALRPAGGGGV